MTSDVTGISLTPFDAVMLFCLGMSILCVGLSLLWGASSIIKERWFQ